MSEQPGQGNPSRSKSQIAYHWIKERIARQEYTPGYRLVLSTIAKSLDMSVVPVREAIRHEIELCERELATDLARLPGPDAWSTEDLRILSNLIVTAALGAVVGLFLAAAALVAATWWRLLNQRAA